ncbi:MAG: HEAT repeat domain-containing protein, partial [Armatimonadetes bacterium]|nr:HEAT repeat domain-containing protein [Armatimonadota bacterium]
MEQPGMLAGSLLARSEADYDAWLAFRDRLRVALAEGRLTAAHGEDHWRTAETCAARMIPERVLGTLAPAEIRLLLCACAAHDLSAEGQFARQWLIREPDHWSLDQTFAATLRRVCEVANDITRLPRAPRWAYLGGCAVDLHRVVAVLHVAERLDPEHTDCPLPPKAELEPDKVERWPNEYGVSVGLIDPREGVMRIDLTSTERAQRRAAEAVFLPWCDEALKAVRNILLACGMPFREVEAHDLHARPSADMLAAQEMMKTRAGTRRRPPRPFKFLDPYTEEEGHLLPARDDDVVRLSGRCLVSPLTVLTGESGVGKTSLAAAGVIPWLRLHEYEGVYARCLNDPIAALFEAAKVLLPAGREAVNLAEAATILADTYDRPVVLVLDQAQELFTRLGSQTRLDFAQQVAELLSIPGDLIHLLIVVQREFFHRLVELQPVLPTIYTEVVDLPRLTRDQAYHAIQRSLGRFRLRFDELVTTHVLDDLSTVDGILPVELQLACDVLHNAVEEDETRIGYEVYRRIGPARRMIGGILDQRLRGFWFRRQTLARSILVNCVTAQRTKAVLTAEECAVDTGTDLDTVREVLEALEEQKLLHRLSLGEKDAWELRHEYVAGWLEPYLKAAETEAKDVDDLLHRELNNFERFGLLLDKEKLGLIHQVRRRLSFTPEELELAIRSAAAENFEVDYWFQRASELSVSQQMVLCIDLLYSPQPELRDALRAMISRLDHQAVLPTLLASLQEAEPTVRETALALLGEVDQQIVVTLTQGDAVQQQQAAYALGQLGARHAVLPLVEQVQSAEVEEVREQAAEALAEIDRTRSADLLLRSLRSGSEESKWNAAMALGRLGRDASVRERLKREAERREASEVLLFAFARSCVEGRQFPDAERLLRDLERRAVPTERQPRIAQAWDDLRRLREADQRGALTWPMYRGSACGSAYSPSCLSL